MAPKRKHLTWTAGQQEFRHEGRNKLVKRSEAVPYRKIGKHKLVIMKPPPSTSAVVVHHTKTSINNNDPSSIVNVHGTSTTVLPRKAGRNKLVFASTTATATTATDRPPPPPVTRPPPPPVTRQQPPPRLHAGRNKLLLTHQAAENPTRGASQSFTARRSNKLVLSKKDDAKKDNSSKKDEAERTTINKYLRANFKATSKHSLKRVEPPICKYFQFEGMCFDKDCPYRHVKVGRLTPK